MDVLVTGATGRLGRLLPDPRRAAGHTVRQVSRRGAGPGGVRGDLAREWARRHAPETRVVALPVPGKLSAAFRDGAAVPSGAARGRISYAEHLRH